MGRPQLDSLLSPERVAVVGPSGRIADVAPEIVALDTATVVRGARDDWLATADLALVTDGTNVEATVPALIAVGVDTLLVAVDVPDRTWFGFVEQALDEGVELLGPDARLGRPATGLTAGIGETLAGGAVAVLTDDGPTLDALVAEGVDRSLGFSLALATGRHPTVRPADVVGSLDVDRETDVVLIRPERIDRDLYGAAGGASADLSVVVLAPKRACTDAPIDVGPALRVSPAALRDATLAQAGVVSVDSVDRLLDLAPALAEQPLPDGDRVVVVSNAGGPGVMATDAVGASRLTMADLAEATVERLEEALPDRAFARNPLDLLADSDIAAFRDVLDAVLTDPGVDAAVVISAPNPLFTFEELAEMIADARSRHDSPVVTALMGGGSTDSAAARLREVGIPNYFDPFQAVRVIAALADQRDAAARRRADVDASVALPVDEIRTAIDRMADARDVVRLAGIPTESDTGGVTVSIGATRTSSLGPIVAVGVTEYADVLDDVAIRVAPIGPGEAHDALEDLRASQLLGGARGTAATDVDALADAISRVSAIPSPETGIDSVRVTVAVGERGVSICDADVRTDYQ
ncbi:MAG: acetate--CoA ligase family protein [Halanaeroarchaeum sp.]